MNLHENAVRRLRRQIGLALILKQTLPWLTAWAVLWGTVVVLLRAVAGTTPSLLVWGLAAAPLLGVLAAWRALRRLPSPSAVRAALDRAGGCGGLLMAAAERDLGRWQETLGSVAGLRVRWRGGRSWAAFAAAGLFLVVSLTLPQRLASLGRGHSLEVGSEVEKLASQLDILKEEAILEPERADALKEKLADLKKEASGEDPAKTLEALDHLQQVAARAAQEAAEAALKKTESLSRAEALAEGLRKASGTLNRATREEAMAELAERLRKAARDSRRVDKSLAGNLARERHPRVLSRKELKALAEALRAGKKDLARTLDRLARAGLIDPEALKKMKQTGHGDAAALAALLKERGGKMPVKDMIGLCEGKDLDGKPGRGGVTEGGSKTPLTWKQATTEEGVKFKEEKLPPASLTALKDSQVIGISNEVPQMDRSGGPSRAGALGAARAGGGSAQTQVLLPRHRGVVRRYFARPPAKK